MAARILVVEDNAQALNAYVKLLQIQGYYVRGADGYQSAAESAKKEVFDLLLSGIGLWDGDGCDLLQELQGKHNIKGVAVTGYGHPDDVQRCLDAGFTYHVLKPVSAASLLETIGKTLSKM